MKTEELEKIGLDKDQVSAVMKMNGTDIEGLKKENQKLTDDRDNWKGKAETAEKTLEGFEGKDFDQITKERDEWKKRAEDAEKEYTAKLETREKEDLLKEAFAELKFTSESAKKAIMAQVSESVTVKNGKLIGLNDLLEDARKNDADAFVNEEQQQKEKQKARFTQKTNPEGSGGNMTKEQIMAVSDRSERRRLISENMDLFSKGE